MPELFSRMDETNWLTPSIADVLEQGSTSNGDNSIRDIITTLQNSLNQLETPARVVNVRNLTSYTLFITKPETVGRLGNRRTIRPEEIEASVAQLNKKHPEWLLGYSPTVPNEDADMVGIFIKTENHHPLNLRRVLVRNNFRKYPSTMVAPVGIDLNQQMYLRDLAKDNHIAIASHDNKHQHLIRSTLLTLMLLNTPAELRLAIGGAQTDPYKLFIGTPHALGRLLTSPDNMQHLFDGLSKEIKRRQQLITNNGFDNFDDYNLKLQESNFNILPRVLVTLDNVGHERWQEGQGWHKALIPILQQGADVGIHLLIAFSPEDESLMRTLTNATSRLIVMESVREDLVQPIENFHTSLYPFVTAYAIEDKYSAAPIEIFTVTNTEIRQAVEYWRANATQRQKETIENITGKTGVTDMLVLPEEENAPQRPPVPDVPSVQTLQKATQALAGVTDTDQQPSQMPKPPTKTLLDNVHQNRAAQTHSTQPHTYQQARTLAAYLGWLSIGALQEILLCDTQQAQIIFQQLQTEGIIEDNQPIARFLRV